MTPRKHTTILLVDDEKDFLDGTRLILESAGYRVLTAMDSETALAHARQGGVELAVLDVNMPGKDGYVLCQSIREMTDAVDFPVLFLSVRREMKDILHGIAVGARDFLTKPIGRLELLRAVDKALAA